MPVKLDAAMRECLENWEVDLSDAWRSFLGEITLGFDDIDAALELEFWEPIFPVRRNKHFPGMPKGAHSLRAFDGIEPQSVKCVILGQDPYPEPGFATGRAFEAGNIKSWSDLDQMFSKSVRAFMQQIVAARTKEPCFARSFTDWPSARETLQAPEAKFEAPFAMADHWVSEGVLLLNSALTLSRFTIETDLHQSHGHVPLWQPLINRVLHKLIARDVPLVIIAFGDVAIEGARNAGLSEGLITRPHPAFAQDLLSRGNPFIECNDHLEAVGAEPIAW